MKTAAYWCVAVAILMVGLAMARSWENPSITALEWVVMRWVRIVGLIMVAIPLAAVEILCDALRNLWPTVRRHQREYTERRRW